MSDIGDIRITTSVDTSAATTATEVLSRSILQLVGQINSYSTAASKATSSFASLERITADVGKQTKTLMGFVQAYGTAQNVTNKTIENANSNLRALDATLTKVGSSNAKLTSSLKSQQAQFTAITQNAKALNRALTGAAVQQWSQRSQNALKLSTQSLLRTTAQTLAFTRALRTAFFSFADLEQQSVRITKLLADNFGAGAEGIATAKEEVKKLGLELDKITAKYGTSRVLVQSIAGDFAELGISGNQALAGLTELTSMVEKLGNVDITQSQKFVESMLQNILRVKREIRADQGLSLDITNEEEFSEILYELRGQLAEFNYIENKTTLSLKDIADALPEVSAAATTYGLSMTEAAAMLVPMVAAGFQVGASANSIKVSLQRMVAMTKQNTQIIAGLNQALGPDFDYAAGISMSNIQKLVDGFNTLRESYGDQGTLELFARLFGVRQGPRMETSIRQAAIFQRNLETAGTTEQKIAESLQNNINERLRSSNLEEIQLKKIVDISNLHRDATERVNGEYTDRAKIIREGQELAFQDLNKQFAKLGAKGADFISKIGTEYGKVIMATGFRIEDTAQEQLRLELELALDTTITRFRILKEEILAIGRVVVTAFDPIIKIMLKIAQPIRDFLQNLSEGSKKLLSFGVILLALTPTLKILSMSFKYFYATSIGAIAKLITGFGKYGSKIISTTELVDRGAAALRGYSKAIQFSPERILLTGRSRRAVADVAGLSPSLKEAMAASGGSPTISTIKSALKRSVGLPDTSAAMVGLASAAGDTAEAAAEAAKAAGGTLDALTAGVSDAFKAGFKGTTFVSNRFLGNTFGGKGSLGGPGPAGGRGGGSPSRTVDGSTARRVPKRPIYGPELPPPAATPAPATAVIPPVAPADTRPVYGPKLPKATAPVKASDIADVFKTPVVPKVDTSGPRLDFAGLKKRLEDAKKIPVSGGRVGIEELKQILARGTADAAAVVATTGAAIGETVAGGAGAAKDAVAKISDTATSVKTKAKAVGSVTKKAVGASKKAAALVELTGHEIATAVRNAGQVLPDEFAFLDNLKKTWLMTEKEKKAVLKQVSEYAAAEKAAGRALSSTSGPLGTIKTTGTKGSKLYPSGTGRALAVSEKGGTKAVQATMSRDILAERLARNKTGQKQVREIQNVIEYLQDSEAKAISDAMETSKTGTTKAARRAAIKQAEATKAALWKNMGDIERKLQSSAKYAGLVPGAGIEEIGESTLLVTNEIATTQAELDNVVRDLDKAILEKNKSATQRLTIRRAELDQRLIKLRKTEKSILRSRASSLYASTIEKTKLVEASPIAKQFGSAKEDFMPGYQRSANLGIKGLPQSQVDKTLRSKLDELPILMKGGRPGQTVINKYIDAKAAYEAFVLDEIDKINEGIKKFDRDLIDKLERHYGYKINPKREMDKATNRQAVEKLARSRVNVSALDPAHPDYNLVEQKRVLGRSRIGERVSQARIQRAKDMVTTSVGGSRQNINEFLSRAEKEAAALKTSLDKTSLQYTDDAVSKRAKLARTFKKQRAALLRQFGTIDKALESYTADLEKAAKLPAGYLSKPVSETSKALPQPVVPTAARVAAPVVAASGAGSMLRPGGGVTRVFFSDAVKAASASVTGSVKTIGSEVARLLDDVLIKAIPAGFDPAKAKVIRAVVGDVLARTPITAASAATPAAQKFMSSVLGTLGPDIAKIIDSLVPDITQAISAGGISAKGGIIQAAKARTRDAFNKLKKLPIAQIVSANLRTGVEAAVFDAVAAAGYAIESTTSSIGQAIASGTFTEAMIPDYLNELNATRIQRGKAAVESGEKGGKATSDGKPKLTREQKNAATRRKRGIGRLMKDRGIDVTSATALYDEAVKSGDDAVKELLPSTRKKVKDAVTEIAETPAAALEGASKAASEAVEEAKEEIVKSIDEAVEATKPAAGPPRARTPKEIIDTRSGLDIRKSRKDEIKAMYKAAGISAPDIEALRKAEVEAQEAVNKALKNKAVFEKNVLDAKTPREAKYWQNQAAAANRELAVANKSLASATDKLNKEQARLTRAMATAKKKIDAAPAAAPVTPGAGTPPAAPAAGRAPRAPTVSTPTTTATVVTSSAIVEKLDDVIVEFDRSLANFFKGPNFFQGPNYFAGPLTVMPNAKFKDYKKSIKDATPSEKDARLRKLLERSAARRAKDPAATASAAAGSAAVSSASAAKAGVMSKIGAALGSGLSKGAGLGLKAVKVGFDIIGKSSAEFFKMSIAFIDIYAKALTGASASSKMAAAATRALAIAKSGLNAVSAKTTKFLNAAKNATLAFAKALAVTTQAELKTFLSSLQNSKILKMWGFLLFTGMKPVIKAFGALIISAGRFMLTLKFNSIIASFQNLYQMVLRTALSFTALAIKINAAMLLISPILILVFTIFSKLKRGFSDMSPSMENFKAAWIAIKDAIYMLAAPLENLILAFAGFNGEASSTGRTAGVIYTISLAVRSVAEAFQKFASGPGLKYMNSAVVPIITRLVNRFKLLGGAIKNALSGNMGAASKDFKGFLYSMIYEFVAFVQKIVAIAAMGLELIAPSLARIVDSIVAATISAFRKILIFTREVMMLIGSIVGAIGLVTGQWQFALGGAAIAGGGAAFLFLDKKLAEFEENARTGGLGAGEFIANGLVKGAKGAANGLEGLKGFIAKKYKNTVGKGINDALVGSLKDLPKDVKDTLVKSAQDAQSAGEGLGGKIAKAIKKGMQDLKEEFTDKFFGKADSEVDKFVEKLKEGLQEQKDKALEAFDNQVEAIEALAEAEERLTAKIEYEEKRREMIRERALNKENYLRERKVAAYEGRSEDVRSLDLSFRKSSAEEQKNLGELDLERAKVLQAENRQNAIKVINKEKEALIKEYENMFKNFEEKIELIKARGFSTEDEFKQMFTNLQTAASGFSDEISGSFEKSMMSLPSAIRKYTDPAIGMFGVTMDKLIDEAKKSFGAGVSSENTESILGAAYFLVKGMPDAFSQAFAAGVISTYVTPFATKVKGELASITPSDLWVKSAGLAIMEMVNEMKRKLVGLKGTLYDDMKTLFGEMTEEDWNRIFNFSGAFADLENLKEYFSNLFPTAEKLKKQIITIETARSESDSGGGEKPKAAPGLTPSEQASMQEDFKIPNQPFDGKALQDLNAKYDQKDPKKGYFGKLKDIIVGIADYLGPVKTAILGFVGIVAGMTVALPAWAGIKSVILTITGALAPIPVIIGTIIGLLIYAYLRFESVRNAVNNVAKAIWDSLVVAFNFLKDIGIQAFDGIKIAFGNLWDGFNNIALPQIKNLWDGFTSGFAVALDFLKDQLVRRWNVIVEIVKSLFGPIKEVWKASLEAAWSIAKNIFENIWNVLKELFVTLKVIFEPIIKIVIGAFIILTEVITRVMEGLKGPIIGIGTIIAKTFTFLYPIFANIANFIIDVLGGAIVGVLKVIRVVFQGVYAVIGFVVKGLYKSVSVVVSAAAGIAKAIFNILNAIWTNPVVKWIRDFLFRVLMLGIFIVAKLLETFAKTIFNSFKTVFNIFKAVAGFVYDSLKPGLELIWTVIKAVFTPVVKVLKGVWQIIKWIYDEFGILGLIMTPFIVAFQLIKRALEIAWNVAKAFFETFMVVGRIVFSLVKDLAKAIWNGLGKVWDLISPIVSKFWDGLKIAAEFVWGLIKSVGQGIWDALGWVWDKIGLVAGKFWDGLKTVAKTVWDFIKTVGQGIWNGLGWIWDKIGGVAKAFWEGLKNAAQNVWNFLKTIGGGIWNAIGWVWDKIGGVANGAWDLIKSGAQIAWDFLKTVGEGVWENLGKIWDLISGAAQKLWDIITGGWDQIAPVLEQIWSWLWDGIKWAWDQLSETVQFYWDLFKQMWDSIEPILSQLWDWLWTGIKWVWDQLVDVVQFYWDLFKQMWGWIEPVLSKLWDWLWTGIKFAWDKITDAVGFMWEKIKQVWGFIQPLLDKMWGLLWDGIKLAWDGITTAVQFVWDKIKAMWKGVFPIFKAIWEWIKDKIGAAVDGVKGAWNGLKDAVNNTFSWFKEKFSSIGDFIREGIGGAVDWVSDKLGDIPKLFKGALNAVVRGVNNVTGFSFTMPDWLKYVPGLGGIAGKTYSFRDVIPELPQIKYNGGMVGSYMKGGMAYGYGGMTSGFPQQAVPAILHGGEYIINHKAAQRIGTDTLDALNNLRLSKPRYPRMPVIPGISMPNVRIDNSTQAPVGSSTQNVNIYVDNFIGEPEWFNSMMRDYNTKILPRNQKAAGLENRVIRTYNGLNRGG